MALIGHARVSIHEQTPEAQEAELRAAGAEKIFVDHRRTMEKLTSPFEAFAK